ncbi:Peroxiredoxin [Promicromonospora umidemergens]|uniref:Peroxiredoxin-like family protein n=1 Tax=Promicromonospora umidemergens TaxID=629679 RepID=A0ABP8XVI1_9MICO|nr:peroxiredoxin-like family protein [Promicromonospora umidemergens]MCP2286003.1 Peroxiredoxin [Promicromonospora umidemergens]
MTNPNTSGAPQSPTQLQAPPRPRTRAPELVVDLLDGSRWNLAGRRPENFTMIVFYRGLHCPVCRDQLAAIRDSSAELESLGVDVIAISAEDEHRTRRVRDDWDLPALQLGYDLSVQTMRDWGLFVSAASNDNEPAHFSEPAVFLVDAEQEIYYAALTSMPFGRPGLADLLGGIRFVTRTGYPAGGDR